MISVWLLVLVLVLAAAGIALVVWLSGRGLQSLQAIMAAEIGALEEELGQANAKVVELLEEVGRLNSYIDGHQQFVSRQYLSQLLVASAVDPTWMTAEAQKAIRDRIGKHVGDLVRIETEEDPKRREIVYTGYIRLRDILDSFAVVETIMVEDTATDGKED